MYIILRQIDFYVIQVDWYAFIIHAVASTFMYIIHVGKHVRGICVWSEVPIESKTLLLEFMGIHQIVQHSHYTRMHTLLALCVYYYNVWLRSKCARGTCGWMRGDFMVGRWV